MNRTRLRRTYRAHRAPLALPLLVLAFVAGACAGDVGRYRDAAGTGDQAALGLDPGISGGLETPGAGSAVAGSDGRPDAGGSGGGATGGATQPGAPAQLGDAGPAPAEGGAPTAPGAPPVAAAGSHVGVTPTQVTLGLMFPESGPYAGLTRNFPVVVRAAFEEVNASGGIHGRQLVLETYDDAGSNAETVTANARRARDESFALMSVVNTTSDIVAPLAEEDGLPFFATSLSAGLGQTLRYSFAGFPYWDTQSRILPSFIVNRLRAQDQNIGVVFESTQPAEQAKDVFVAEARRAGLTVGFEQPVATNQASCVNEVSNLQSRGAELVVMIAGPLAAICMLRDAGVVGFDPTWAGFGSMWGVSAVSTAAGGSANGISLLGSETTLETPAGIRYQEVVRRHAPNSRADTDDASIRAFGLAQLVIEAVRRAGPDLNRERLVQVMESEMSGFDSGFLSPPQFGPGDRRGPQGVSVIQCCVQNRWTTVDPAWRDRF